LDQKEDPVVNDDAELLTVREVARQLRVDDTTVRRWIKNGVLEAITLPHRGARQAYRIRRATLEALLAAPPQESVGQ
jgi:excisionase family DNA binding protein